MVETKPFTSLKISFIAAFFTAVFFVFLFVYLGVNLRQYIYDDSKEIAKEISRKAAIETEQYFSSALDIALSMGQRAILIRDLGGKREHIREILKYELQKNPYLLGTWTLWEPNAFDGKDYLFTSDSLHNSQGTFGNAYFRYNNRVYTEIMKVEDYLGHYYKAVKEKSKEKIVEPYKWAYSGHSQSFFGTTISVPLINNDTFLGAIGIDIDLENLSERLNKVRLYKSGHLSLIASNGVIVSHVDTSFVTKNFFQIIHDSDSLTYNSIINGEELIAETTSEFTGKKVFRFFYPFSIGAGKPWTMMVEIPIADATHRSNQLIIISFIILLVGLGLIVFLVFNIIDRRRYERTIIVAMNEIEKRSELAAQNEQNYREIFNSTNEAIFIHDETNGQVIDVNDVMIQMYGYSNKQEVIKVPISNFSSNIEPYSNIKGSEYISKAISEGPQVFDWHARKKDGDLFWVEVSLRKTHIGGKGRVLAVVRDITDRKNIEEKLRESQQLFETLAKTAPVGIFRTRADGYTIYVNPKWTQLSGLSFEQAMGDGWMDAVHPEDLELLKIEWSGKVVKAEPSAIQYRFLRNDGRVVWVLGNAVPEIIDGKINGYIGTITDITDLRFAQDKLKTSEKRFRDLAELLPQTIWETDITGKVVFVNKNGLIILGYNEKDIENGMSIFDAIVPDDRQRAIENTKERLSGKSSKGEEYTGLRKDGTTFPVQIFTSTIYDKGVPVGLRGITIDMTEIKKAENQIRESEERYKTMIDAFSDIIMISDLGGRIIFGNKELERITGISSKEYTNPTSKVQIHPEDIENLKTSISDLYKSYIVHSEIVECRIIDSNKRIHWISGTISKLKLKNKPYLQVIARDITEKKKIDEELVKYRNQLELLVKERTEELEAANEELTSINEEIVDQKVRLQEALNRLKDAQKQIIQSEKMASLGVLASGISHEINNPLNFIHGGVIGLEKFIQKSLPENIDEITPLINAIKEGVRRTTEIVKSLNHYSRKDNQPKRECDVHAIIDNCILIIHSQIAGRIDIIKEYSQNVNLLVCNEGTIHQAFLNILINAVQSIEKNGTISIKTERLKNSIRVLFVDNGCGMSNEIIQKITDPFFTTKNPGEGTGLGLSIASSIIEDHKGLLKFESEADKGTTVIVELPLIAKKP